MLDYEFDLLIKEFRALHDRLEEKAREIVMETAERRQSYHLHGVDVIYSPDNVIVKVVTDDGENTPPSLWN